MLKSTLEDVLMSLNSKTWCDNVSVQYVQVLCVRFEYVFFYISVKTKTELIIVSQALRLKSKILLWLCSKDFKRPKMFCCPWI